LAAVVREYWYEEDGSLAEAGVTNSCQEQRVYWCKCWRHTLKLTTKTLVSKYPSGIDCKICAEVADSSLELVARSALLQAGITFQVYVKVLCGRFGPADLFIPHANLIIAVDGPGHMEEDCKTVPLHVQMAIDRRLNQECIKQGVYLLRMHYKDVLFGDTLQYVLRALRFICRQPSSSFVMYSKRYLVLGWQPIGFAHIP
jgi:hypothetical protein